MKKIIFVILIILISDCDYTIKEARHENNRGALLRLLTDVWYLSNEFPNVECDSASRKERCYNNYRQLCNGRGQWQNYELCDTCIEVENQDAVKCEINVSD